MSAPLVAPTTVSGGLLSVLRRNLYVYRRTWRGTMVLTFLSPVLFLAAIGLGLGTFIDRSGPGSVGGVPYLVFLAPGLLAATAMQTAAFESTYPIMGGFVWQRHFQAMLATPLRVTDLVLGQLCFVAFRLTLVCGVFVVVMALFGAARSPFVVLALPAAVLTGLAFAAVITAFAATQRNDNGFAALFRFVITPLFLFSGTFFPIDRLPDVLRPVAYLTPLYHGVALTRGLSLNTLGPADVLLHGAVLLLLLLGGVAACGFTFRRRLVA